MVRKRPLQHRFRLSRHGARVDSVPRLTTRRMVSATILAALTISCSGGGSSSPYGHAPTILPIKVRTSSAALTELPVESLSSGRLITDAVGFRMISAMAFVDSSRMLLVDQRTSPHAVYLDIDARVVSRFGVHGDAPGELIDPILQEVSQENRIATFYDASTALSSAFELPPKAGGMLAQLSSQKAISLPPRTRHLGKIGRSRLLALGDYLEPIGLVMEGGEVVARLRIEHPFNSAEIPHATHRAYMNDHAVSNGGETLPGVAIVHKYFPRLTVLTNALDTQFIADRTEGWAKPYKPDSTGKGIVLKMAGEFQYVAVAANTHEIYALYCGCRPGERFATSIHVFNWRAELVSVLHVDIPIYSLAVSADGCRIAGAAWQDWPGVRVWERTASSKRAESAACQGRPSVK